MADLGPAIIALAGTATGALITGITTVVQARTSERTIKAQLQHERALAEDARQSATRDRLREAQQAALERFVSTLDTVTDEAHSYTNGKLNDRMRQRLQASADFTGDDELSSLVRQHAGEMSPEVTAPFMERVREMLRGEP